MLSCGYFKKPQWNCVQQFESLIMVKMNLVAMCYDNGIQALNFYSLCVLKIIL